MGQLPGGRPHARKRSSLANPWPLRPAPFTVMFSSGKGVQRRYGNDAVARAQGPSPEERLRFHQAHSGLVVDSLHAWLKAQFEESGKWSPTQVWAKRSSACSSTGIGSRSSCAKLGRPWIITFAKEG